MYEMDSTGSWLDEGGSSDAGGMLSSAGSIASMATGNPLFAIGGQILGGLFGGSSAKSQNKAQIKAAREQMAWQERMSNTAHQREVADLRAAGLNPILSATKGGSGSSTPSGAMPQIQNEGAAAMQSAASALALQQGRAQLDLLEAQTEKTLAETATERTRPGLVTEQTNVQGQTFESIGRDIENKSIQNTGMQLDNDLKEWQLLKEPAMLGKVQAELDTLAAQLHEAENRGDISKTTYGKFLSLINMTSQALQGSASAAASGASAAKTIHGIGRPQTVTGSSHTSKGLTNFTRTTR